MRKIIISLSILIVFILAALFVGGGRIGLPSSEIFLNLRLPRVLMALLIGSGLSISGLCLQRTLHNNLADPYVLGIAGGASFGATIWSLFSTSTYGVDFAGRSIFAMAFGSISFIIILLLLPRLGDGVLLIGIISNGLFAAMTRYFIFFISPEKLQSLEAFWTGYVPYLPLSYAIIIGLFVAIVVILIQYRNDLLTITGFGNETIITSGVSPLRVRFFLLGVACILASILSAFCGMVGFVGLIIPHIAGRIAGGKMKIIAAITPLLGGAFLVLSDTIARLAGEFPVGAITSILGAPVFFIILIRRSKNA